MAKNVDHDHGQNPNVPWLKCPFDNATIGGIPGRQWPWSFQLVKILTITIVKFKFLEIKMVNLKFDYEIEFKMFILTY